MNDIEAEEVREKWKEKERKPKKGEQEKERRACEADGE